MEVCLGWGSKFKCGEGVLFYDVFCDDDDLWWLWE